MGNLLPFLCLSLPGMLLFQTQIPNWFCRCAVPSDSRSGCPCPRKQWRQCPCSLRTAISTERAGGGGAWKGLRAKERCAHIEHQFQGFCAWWGRHTDSFPFVDCSPPLRKDGLQGLRSPAHASEVLSPRAREWGRGLRNRSQPKCRTPAPTCCCSDIYPGA